MTKVRILGCRRDVTRLVEELHRLGLVEIADVRHSESVDELAGEPARTIRREQLQLVASQVTTLLGTDMPGPVAERSRREPPLDHALDLGRIRSELDRVTPRVEALDRRLDALRDEAVSLPGYIEPLRRLLPLVPELADLDDERLRLLRLDTAALVLNTDDGEILETLRDELAEELGACFELVWTRIQDGAIGCLVVYPHDHDSAVRGLLGAAQVRQAALPEAFQRVSLRAAVEAMERRFAALPGIVEATHDERAALLRPHVDWLTGLRSAIADELERLDALKRLGATRRAFVAVCWIPRGDVARLRREIASRLGANVLVEDLGSSPRDPEAPLLMRNVRLVRPFEPLARFLELPRPGSVDPTLLLAIFFPLMFGAMVGDVGYGIALLTLAFLVRRSSAARTPVVAGMVRILQIGAVWAIIFGVLFGELFGDLGKRVIGDWALWRYRPAADALEPLLLFAVAIGAAHVVLGLGMGAWQAVRFREHRELVGKIGSLLVLAGLFGVAAGAQDRLPAGAATPSVGAVVVGLVLVMSPHGLLGLVTGPLGLLGTLGNVLSYLRLAAVGLASAHLAGVANELGTVGPIWMGVLVAAFFHALNLALAVFSPTIQGLRLHYVEFFGTFLVGGGRAFSAFGHARTTPTQTPEEQTWKLA
jgi:V/A-type H+-transporting ATPase subunit I